MKVRVLELGFSVGEAFEACREVCSVAQLTTELQRSGQMSVCFLALSAHAGRPDGLEMAVAGLASMGGILPSVVQPGCDNFRGADAKPQSCFT
jgi:hypothetical protein